MKTTFIILALVLLSVAAFAECQSYPCSLNVKLVDWKDAPTNYNFRHDGGEGYTYTGTYRWDLAMGDSFLVWLPGTDRILFLDSYNTSEIDTIANFDYGSVEAVGVTNSDTITYIVGGGGANTILFRNDSLIVLGGLWTGFADYCYAVVEDSFLYTCNIGESTPMGLTCINIADPESIFIYRVLDHAVGRCGLEVVDGYAYQASASGSFSFPPPEYEVHFIMSKNDMVNSDSAMNDSVFQIDNRCLGDLASNDSLVFYVNCEMTPGSWAIGHSNLYVWDRDYTFAFDSSLWFGQGVFGVDVIDDRWLAVGFEHGFSILDIEDLTDIHEVAYYQHIDSVMDFTHFALKENRLYAMGHLDEGGVSTGTVRLWMFELDTASIILGQSESSPPMPDDFRIRAYPNPFNSAITISVDCRGLINQTPTVEIFDIAGRRVADILVGAGLKPARAGGSQTLPYEIVWRPGDLPSGIYLARIKSDDMSLTTKLVYLA